MATKIRKKTSSKQAIRFRRKRKIRSRVQGSAEKPRISIFRSNFHLYAQVIDDDRGVTLASASTQEEELRGKAKKNIQGAKALGNLLAKRALAKKIQNVVFDRSGYVYHGRIKALADAAREGGLKF